MFVLNFHGLLKRENPEEDFNSEDEDFETRSDLKPEVVVLRPGDLTAEEADLEKARLERGNHFKKVCTRFSSIFNSLFLY